jgi:hypothetical protein
LNISEKLDIKILARDTDAVNLRIKEALLIKERRPQLNSREEMRELDVLI